MTERLLLYLVLDPSDVGGRHLDVASAAIRGGVTAIQLRSKHHLDRETLNAAHELRSLTAGRGVLFLINDRIDLALACHADGVHLGVDDLPLEDARRIGGPDLVIGFSPETDQQTEQAGHLGASYLGVGPVFSTSTKADAGPPIGLEAISRRTALTELPIIGIGGIAAATAGLVVKSGACGVAVASAITGATDPEHAARSLRMVLNE